MKQSEKIKEPVSKELNEFEKKFFDSMTSDISLLNRISYFIVNKKGKQLRPLLVFLCAKLINKEVNEKTYRGAAVVELIHTATLVHDDVIDDSNQRRGFFSINALWKNKIAVLFGDYLLSKGLLLCINNNDFDLLKIISEAVKEMSEGEILQIEKSRDLNINESDYYEIIKKKTASLIIACCRMGVQSISDDKKNIKSISAFALNTGMAFQIKDDLFDYSGQKIGKPVGIDIREKKITLPMIYVLNSVKVRERKWLINSIKVHNKNKKRVKEVINFVKGNGGLVYAENKMNEYKSKALKSLKEFKKNKFRDTLELTLNYIISRKL